MTPCLSICIPTMDRGHVLDSVLASLAVAIAGFPIEVCVSDNASLDNTAGVLARWSGQIHQLSVIRQAQRVGYDENVSAVVSLASAGYVWLLPDYAHVSREVIGRILVLLAEEPIDAVFLNIAGRIDQRDDLILHSANDAFVKFGWHATLVGSFILPYSAYSGMAMRFAGSDFIHFEACFTALAERGDEARIAWIGQDAWRPDPLKKIAWGAKMLTIWMSHWRASCLSLPDVYSLAEKLLTIREHHRRSGIFRLRSLCLFRANGGCSLVELWTVRDSWKDSGLLYVTRAALIGLVPAKALAWIFELRNRRV